MPSTLEDNYNRAKIQATKILEHAGDGGKAIDVDKMLTDDGYESRPWENDAIFCGYIANEYWYNPSKAPSGYINSECTRVYDLSGSAISTGRSSTLGGK